MTADAARAVLGGDEAESYAAQRELTRALLAHLRFGNNQNETCAAQKAYVDSLPWDGVEDVKLKDAWRPTIMRVADRAGVADDDAARAVQLSRSRGLDLGTSAEDAERLHAMVPFLDLFNHPSLSALENSGARERVGKASVFDSCVKWYLSDDRTRVLVDAPSALHSPSLPGSGTATTPRTTGWSRRARAHEQPCIVFEPRPMMRPRRRLGSHRRRPAAGRKPGAQLRGGRPSAKQPSPRVFARRHAVAATSKID